MFIFNFHAFNIFVLHKSSLSFTLSIQQCETKDSMMILVFCCHNHNHHEKNSVLHLEFQKILLTFVKNGTL